MMDHVIEPVRASSPLPSMKSQRNVLQVSLSGLLTQYAQAQRQVFSSGDRFLTWLLPEIKGLLQRSWSTRLFGIIYLVFLSNQTAYERMTGPGLCLVTISMNNGAPKASKSLKQSYNGKNRQTLSLFIVPILEIIKEHRKPDSQ